MPSRMLLIGLGALLVLCGLVLVATRVIKTGPLSRSRQPSRAALEPTLEPEGRSGVFSLKAQLPGVTLLSLGIIILIAAISA